MRISLHIFAALQSRAAASRPASFTIVDADARAFARRLDHERHRDGGSSGTVPDTSETISERGGRHPGGEEFFLRAGSCRMRELLLATPAPV